MKTPMAGKDKQGSCQICERIIKANTGVIAHHGYQRPYQAGWQSASCYGARHLPYEQSCDVIPEVLQHIKAYVSNQKRLVKELMETPPETITRIPHYIGDPNGGKKLERPAGFDPKANLEKGAWSGGYEYEHAAQVRLHKREVEGGERDIKRLTKRLSDWKPQ